MSTTKKKPAVCWETDPDEAFLIGTKEELTQFANSIIEQLKGISSEGNYHGIDVRIPKSSQSLTEVMSDIVIQGLTVVETTQERQELLNRFRKNNGMDEIHWVDDDSK